MVRLSRSVRLAFAVGLLLCLLGGIQVITWPRLSSEEELPNRRLSTDLLLVEESGTDFVLQPGFHFNLSSNSALVNPRRAWNRPEHRLCVIVPFREFRNKRRQAQLERLAPYLNTWLQERGVSYVMIVAEQEVGLPFNRGAVLNLGFLVSYHLCDYVVFHDVDNLPNNPENNYRFPPNPIHLASAVHAEDMFPNVGGVLMAQSAHVLDLGGWTNLCWGWGNEDVEMYYRLQRSSLTLDKLPLSVGTYRLLNHKSNSLPMTDPQWALNMKVAESKRHGLSDPREGLLTIEGSILEVVSDTPTYQHYIFRLSHRENLLPPVEVHEETSPNE